MVPRAALVRPHLKASSSLNFEAHAAKKSTMTIHGFLNAT